MSHAYMFLSVYTFCAMPRSVITLVNFFGSGFSVSGDSLIWEKRAESENPPTNQPATGRVSRGGS